MLIAEKAEVTGVRGFDVKEKSGAALPVLTSRQCWILETFKFL